MTLREYLQANFKWLKIDQYNEYVIDLIDKWCQRDPSFNDGMLEDWKLFDPTGVPLQTKYHLDKGLLLYGNVGSGKTELVRAVSKYLFHSPYKFKVDRAWRYADKYREDERCFDPLYSHNMFFDELCLTDQTGYPVKEIVNNYGNKILVGEEIIRIREIAFTNRGYQTHFTTNEPPKKLGEVYGPRSLSRLLKMENFIPFLGPDRRIDSEPIIHSSIFLEQEQKQVVDEKDQEELDRSMKRTINEIYQEAVASDFKLVNKINMTVFERMKIVGIECATEKEIVDKIIPKIKERKLKLIKQGKFIQLEDFHNTKRIAQMYLGNTEFDYIELSDLHAEAKTEAVITYFKKRHKAKDKNIFENI